MIAANYTAHFYCDCRECQEHNCLHRRTAEFIGETCPRLVYVGKHGHGHVAKRPARFPRFMRPYQYGQLKGKRYVIADLVEALVYLAAHELRHLWQAGGPGGKRRKGMAWGARGRFSEIDTESFAINRLRAWRRYRTESDRNLKKHLARIQPKPAPPAVVAARKREAALDAITAEQTRLAANAARWDAKLRRATNALKKINRQQKALARRKAKLA